MTERSLYGSPIEIMDEGTAGIAMRKRDPCRAGRVSVVRPGPNPLSLGSEG